MQRLGVEIDQFGKQSIVVNTFSSTENVDVKSFLENCIENIKNSNDELEHPYHKIAWNISTNYAHKTLKKQNRNEMALFN